MKRILITGKDSYIGTHFKKYLEEYPEEYKVEELDVRDDSWKEHDFTPYDVVFHVAGLAHSTPDESQRELYYRVNTDLTYDVAEKAKRNRVKQFIFMSSIIVYGSGRIGEDRTITKDTPLTPDNFYGDSKKQAELKIRPLDDNNFKIVIIRPPMIYGPGSKGNYPLLAKFAKKTPIFPTLDNERSMLFLGNLMEFIKLMIDNEESGIFLPQNAEYVSSKELIKEIARIHKHRIFFIGIFNPLIRWFNKNVYVNKVFGNLTIDKELSNYKNKYNKSAFKESIMQTEGRI
ncbi:MAG: NAD-dependent epimerase/dehydratase family protein [Beduini sp.]|uniref:NAD-dependent epimerase/dehydratase family protein n=1 Tax=Beduini sp. TaxID=1922300 RepID=UPI0039A35576